LIIRIFTEFVKPNFGDLQGWFAFKWGRGHSGFGDQSGHRRRDRCRVEEDLESLRAIYTVK